MPYSALTTFRIAVISSLKFVFSIHSLLNVRISILPSTYSGTNWLEFGVTSSLPTIPVTSGPSALICLSKLAAATSASFRLSIGTVESAVAPWKRIVYRPIPARYLIRPISIFSRSSTGPCSMCSSRKFLMEPGLRMAAFRSGFRPYSAIASSFV